jgi:hypothetical protein
MKIGDRARFTLALMIVLLSVLLLSGATQEPTQSQKPEGNYWRTNQNITLTNLFRLQENAGDGAQSGVVEAWTAIDVPAIQVDYVAHKAGEQSSKCWPGDYCTYSADDIQKRWSCEDKERILEVSESGKHWCRKVQP